MTVSEQTELIISATVWSVTGKHSVILVEVKPNNEPCTSINVVAIPARR